ncbi:hypothetical protein BDP27DRAFT_1330820 [Rhodocollybia butyracea]|uniref:Uncharacterized protein n=1 Tax=Rhodocollybia butyracea TaxID=206335 RepID=A0A9P5PN39_9AGAR|nr:hypothetical protein BDP27DRAFT_1330820 [Rhodocollybia butyracea]
MNDDNDSDGDVFDCTPNCYLCHRRAQAEIYEIKQFGDGYDIDYYVEDDGWDSDDTEPQTHHQTECVHCVRERLKAEGWKFPYEQYEEKSARKTSETDKPKDRQPEAAIFSRPPPVLQAETNSTEPISSPRVFLIQDSDQDRQPVFVPPPKSSQTIASRVFFPPSKVLDITAVPRVVFSPPEA